MGKKKIRKKFFSSDHKFRLALRLSQVSLKYSSSCHLRDIFLATFTFCLFRDLNLHIDFCEVTLPHYILLKVWYKWIGNKIQKEPWFQISENMSVLIWMYVCLNVLAKSTQFWDELFWYLLQFKIPPICEKDPGLPATKQPHSIKYTPLYFRLDMSWFPVCSPFLRKDFGLICQNMTPIVVPMMTDKVQVLQIFRRSQDRLHLHDYMVFSVCFLFCLFFLYYPSHTSQ